MASTKNYENIRKVTFRILFDEMFGTVDPEMMETLVTPLESFYMNETAPLLFILARSGDLSLPLYISMGYLSAEYLAVMGCIDVVSFVLVGLAYASCIWSSYFCCFDERGFD